MRRVPYDIVKQRLTTQSPSHQLELDVVGTLLLTIAPLLHRLFSGLVVIGNRPHVLGFPSGIYLVVSSLFSQSIFSSQ